MVIVTTRHGHDGSGTVDELKNDMATAEVGFSIRFIDATKLRTLREAIYYLSLDELKALALKFELPAGGKKAFLIEVIMHFLETRQIKNLFKPR